MPGSEASLYTLPPTWQEDGGFSQQMNKEFPQTIKLMNLASRVISESFCYSTELALSLKGLLTNWNCRLSSCK